MPIEQKIIFNWLIVNMSFLTLLCFGDGFFLSIILWFFYSLSLLIAFATYIIKTTDPDFLIEGTIIKIIVSSFLVFMMFPILSDGFRLMDVDFFKKFSLPIQYAVGLFYPIAFSIVLIYLFKKHNLLIKAICVFLMWYLWFFVNQEIVSKYNTMLFKSLNITDWLSYSTGLLTISILFSQWLTKEAKKLKMLLKTKYQKKN